MCLSARCLDYLSLPCPCQSSQPTENRPIAKQGEARFHFTERKQLIWLCELSDLGQEHCLYWEGLRGLEFLPLLKADDVFLMTSSPNGSELPASVLVMSQKKNSLENMERRDRIFSSESNEGITVQTLG